jgi:hypothetical protein
METDSVDKKKPGWPGTSEEDSECINHSFMWSSKKIINMCKFGA